MGLLYDDNGGFFGNGPDDPRSQMIMGLAQGLLSGRGSAGLAAGIQGMNQAREAITRQQLAKQQLRGSDLQNQSLAMQLEEARRKIADADATRQVVRDYYATRGLPQVGAPGMQTSVNAALPPEQRAPVNATLPTMQPASGQSAAPGGVAPKSDNWLQYRAIGEALAAKGQTESAQYFFGLAEKSRPEYNTTPQEMLDPTTNRVVPVLFGKDGTWKALPYGVKPNIKTLTLGDRVQAVDENNLRGGESFAMGQSPDSRASNSLGWARLAQDKAQAAKPQFHEGAWFTPPTAANPQGGMTRTPAYAPPKGTDEYQNQASNKAIGIIDQAEKLLDTATGSYFGAAYDQGMRAVGKSTGGAQGAAKLKALEGSLMMAQPRMEGPQSDKDVALYRQMAGQVGDPTVPAETKRAALGVIRELHQRYGSAPRAPDASTDLAPNGKASTMSSGGWSAKRVN